jgi:hypothetical protein
MEDLGQTWKRGRRRGKNGHEAKRPFEKAFEERQA